MTTFTGVLYKGFVDHVELDAGDYMIEVFPAGTQTTVLSGMFSLGDNTDYSVFAVGNGSIRDLELLTLQDANAVAPPQRSPSMAKRRKSTPANV